MVLIALRVFLLTFLGTKTQVRKQTSLTLHDFGNTYDLMYWYRTGDRRVASRYVNGDNIGKIYSKLPRSPRYQVMNEPLQHCHMTSIPPQPPGTAPQPKPHLQ